MQKFILIVKGVGFIIDNNKDIMNEYLY